MMNETLDCGCHMWTDTVGDDQVFMFEPHALDCKFYLFVLEESKRQAKPVTTLDLS